MGVNKLYNLYQAGKQISQTAKSPIKQAVEKIKSTFKPKKPKQKIGGTAKSDRIKDINKMDKKAKDIIRKEEATINLAKTDKNIDRKDIVPRAKNLRDTKRIQREIKKFQKETLKSSFKKGGPVDKKNKKFPDLTGDGKVTFADVLKGRGVINGKNKNKKKVIG